MYVKIYIHIYSYFLHLDYVNIIIYFYIKYFTTILFIN